LYYAPGQEYRLQQFANYLNEKDRATMEILRDRKVLMDSELDPLTRVSLRQIKDFAKPIEVAVNNQKMLFWRWYLLSNEEASGIIKNKLKILQKAPEQRKQEVVLKPFMGDGKKEAEVTKKIDQKQQIEERKEKILGEFQKKLEVPKEEPLKKEFLKEPIEITKNYEIERIEKERIEQPSITDTAKQDFAAIKDKFFKRVMNYFVENKISVLDYRINRKESDIDFTIKIPSPVGNLVYFCKAKNKRKFNEGDLSSVFVESQRRKMPVLFIVTGDLTKKAKNMLESEFKNIAIKKI
ncbi:MAG: hypothetical protein N3D84_01535, partial [Candidatus Woesearchaeota archaeon]|nr:hypothetical protein [Candidatus Woesearchaeota archaeon]